MSHEMAPLERIALGTAQFGLAYGVANRVGQVSQAAANEILRYARHVGIRTIDTAIAYGESESRLGKVGVESWDVFSKLPGIPPDISDVASWVHVSANGCLERLRVSRLQGLLLHRPEQLMSSRGDSIYQALFSLKQAGIVEKIGLSVYDVADLGPLLARYAFDVIQAPLNPINRRLITSGWLQRLKDLSIEVHVRSVFLQGLLLMPREERPMWFEQWHRIWDIWDAWLQRNRIPGLQACIGFAMSHGGIDRVVVGVDTVNQLKEIVAACRLTAVTVPDNIESEDGRLINPFKWPSM